MDANQPVAGAVPLEVLEVPECWALLREQPVGRLAVLHDGRPDIFPVNFVVDHGSLVFRTGSGTLFASAAGSWVAFEVDGYAAEEGRAWSVVVRGRAREVHDVDDILDVLTLPLLPWHAGPNPRLVRSAPDWVRGRWCRGRGGDRATPGPARPTE